VNIISIIKKWPCEVNYLEPVLVVTIRWKMRLF